MEERSSPLSQRPTGRASRHSGGSTNPGIPSHRRGATTFNRRFPRTARRFSTRRTVVVTTKFTRWTSPACNRRGLPILPRLTSTPHGLPSREKSSSAEPGQSIGSRQRHNRNRSSHTKEIVRRSGGHHERYGLNDISIPRPGDRLFGDARSSADSPQHSSLRRTRHRRHEDPIASALV